MRLFLCLCLLSCFSAKSQSIEGIWVGNYTNKNLKLPLVRILDFQTKDSTVIIKYFNKPDEIHKFSLKDGILRFDGDTVSYLLDILAKDKLAYHAIQDTIGWTYREYYRPLNAKVFTFKDSLTKYMWQYKRPEKENLLTTTTHIFTQSDKLIESRTYYNQGQFLFIEQEQHCYEISKYKGVTYLLLKTGKDSCTVFNGLEQFVSIVKDTMRVYNPYYSEYPIQYIKTTAKKDLVAIQPFVFCDGTHAFLYAETDADYKGGKKAIFKQIRDKLPPCNNHQSGYIRLGFVMNCKGETGRFNLLEMDRNYLPMRFNNCISNPIIMAVKFLKDWVPGKVKYYWWKNNFDVNYFLMFKIENGAITEIFP